MMLRIQGSSCDSPTVFNYRFAAYAQFESVRIGFQGIGERSFWFETPELALAAVEMIYAHYTNITPQTVKAWLLEQERRENLMLNIPQLKDSSLTPEQVNDLIERNVSLISTADESQGDEPVFTKEHAIAATKMLNEGAKPQPEKVVFPPPPFTVEDDDEIPF